jgi:hypothetical protein
MFIRRAAAGDERMRVGADIRLTRHVYHAGTDAAKGSAAGVAQGDLTPPR